MEGFKITARKRDRALTIRDAVPYINGRASEAEMEAGWRSILATAETLSMLPVNSAAIARSIRKRSSAGRREHLQGLVMSHCDTTGCLLSSSRHIIRTSCIWGLKNFTAHLIRGGI